MGEGEGGGRREEMEELLNISSQGSQDPVPEILGSAVLPLWSGDHCGGGQSVWAHPPFTSPLLLCIPHP